MIVISRYNANEMFKKLDDARYTRHFYTIFIAIVQIFPRLSAANLVFYHVQDRDNWKNNTNCKRYSGKNILFRVYTQTPSAFFFQPVASALAIPLVQLGIVLWNCRRGNKSTEERKLFQRCRGQFRSFLQKSVDRPDFPPAEIHWLAWRQFTETRGERVRLKNWFVRQPAVALKWRVTRERGLLILMAFDFKTQDTWYLRNSRRFVYEWLLSA